MPIPSKIPFNTFVICVMSFVYNFDKKFLIILLLYGLTSGFLDTIYEYLFIAY